MVLRFVNLNLWDGEKRSSGGGLSRTFVLAYICVDLEGFGMTMSEPTVSRQARNLGIFSLSQMIELYAAGSKRPPPGG